MDEAGEAEIERDVDDLCQSVGNVDLVQRALAIVPKP